MKLTVYAFTPESAPGPLRKFFDSLVCWKTGGKWCHIGFSIGDCYFEAAPFVGCTRTYLHPKGAHKIYEAPATRELYVWACRQVGKPYDWLGIWGFVLNASANGRAQRGKWFCSEWGIEMIRRNGHHVMGEIPAWLIDPVLLAEGLR